MGNIWKTVRTYELDTICTRNSIGRCTRNYFKTVSNLSSLKLSSELLLIFYRLQHDSGKRFNSYSEILELLCMENISETPSNDECEFVCNIIAKISNKIS